jgi:hypothetical protein
VDDADVSRYRFGEVDIVKFILTRCAFGQTMAAAPRISMWERLENAE